MDYFLETREGYCVYYASAMTVMARCAGVPSRFVSGFGMRQGENANWYYTSDATAHAWTEIYLQNIGWIAPRLYTLNSRRRMKRKRWMKSFP